jgi:hypothetical protein
LIIAPAHAKVAAGENILESWAVMFFTRIGKVIAHLIFWLASIQVAIAFTGAFGTADMESNRAFASRYLSSATTGEAINKGMMYILLAVALGVLCEISSKRTKPDDQV